MAESVEIPCASCLAINRVARGRLHDRPSCGRCKAPLVPDHPVALDDASFETYVQRAGLPVMVDFWAAWCGPCRMMAPHFEATARVNRGQALFAKVDTEVAQRTAARLGIRSIPTLIAFSGGRELARQSGAMAQPAIESWMRQLVKAA